MLARQVREQIVEVAQGLRLECRLDAFAQLVEGQAALPAVAAEKLDRLVAIGVGRPEDSAVALRLWHLTMIARPGAVGAPRAPATRRGPMSAARPS